MSSPPAEITFALRSEYIELHKLLKVVGFCASGGEAKMAIQDGLVKVDGEPEHRRGRKLRAGARVELAGQVVRVTGSEPPPTQ